jgi:hypothetical protein
MAKNAVTILLAVLLAVSVVMSLFLYSENLSLKSQVLSLKEDTKNSNSSNIVTALGVVDIPYYGENYWKENSTYGNLWITGWVFNSGAIMAKKAGLEVIAFDKANAVLMNYTVPITEGDTGAFTTNETLRNLIPHYFHPTPFEFGNVLSQQNVTIRLAIFHNGNFQNSTKYQITPVWENS